VGVAPSAKGFRSFHYQTAVINFFNRVICNWRPEAGPPCAGIKFCLRAKERQTAANALINAFSFKIVILAGKSRFCVFFSSDSILFRGEDFSPLFVGFYYSVASLVCLFGWILSAFSGVLPFNDRVALDKRYRHR
jgi:hypothetical protein